MRAHRWREHFYPNRGLAISLVILFSATLLSAIFLLFTFNNLSTYLKSNTRNFNTVVRLQNFLVDMRTAESSERGYVINNDADLLADYRQASAAVPRQLAALRADPILAQHYQPQLKQLTDLSQRRLAQFDNVIRVHDTEGRDAALALRFDRGRDTMNDIRDLVESIMRTESAKIAPQEERSNTNLQRSRILIPVLVALVLALCVIIMRYYGRGIEQERAIEGSKNEFLSLASHQLRTPATNVKQYIHLVLDGYFGDLTPDQRQSLETATKNNDIEISIINDLLGVAKLDLNQIRLLPEPSNANQLVRQVVKDFRGPAKKRNQKLAFAAAKGMPKVRLDPTYFKTVVENLIDNASKYSPPHSPITVSAEQRGERYVLTVHDQGVGIPKQQQHRLFKKFSRIPNTLSDSVEGSGLGLYWVKRVIELHGGTVTARSTPNEGTDFVISLPFAGPPEPAN